MKVLFKRICIPMMLINNNVYTFLSGVIISLSINIFSTLCIEKLNIIDNWHLYLSFFMFLLSGAIFIYIATKVSSYQNYMTSQKIIFLNEKVKIIFDFEGSKSGKWLITYFILFFSTLSGFILLLINYFI